jgi:hypothetical protein
MAAPGSTQGGIDPRSPRFGAGITAVLLLVVIGLSLGGAQIAAIILFAAITALFGWGAFAGVSRHPYGLLFRTAIRPRLAPPAELESPKPPTFAQGVGFVITLIGLILALFGVPLALVIFPALAFVAAFLNSVFNYCVGCQIYLLLVRIRPGNAAAA